MSGKPSDVLEQLCQAHAAMMSLGATPPWLGSSAWPQLLTDAITEIKKDRVLIADLSVMRESYSRLYKQIYGND